MRLSLLFSSNYRVIKKYSAARVLCTALGTADPGDPSNVSLIRGTYNFIGDIRLIESHQRMRDKDQAIKKKQC